MPFGLKIAPSFFQRAMVKIFQPLEPDVLIYIDDILLFSSTIEHHQALLKKFQSILLHYGIMLSEKKMHIGQSTIDFLGMTISHGQFQLQPHICQHLQSFPDQLNSPKQVQQFLGIANYMRDFVPKIAQPVSCLSSLLKKDSFQWTTKHTEAVQTLKAKATSLPSLKIPAPDSRLILQTDASDQYWGAALLTEAHGKRHICAYASGRFKTSEQHYHSTFKEILAVRRAIEKFQFHLIGCRFLIEMDMSSFPKMLHFKKKVLPNSQLLRWAEWFSQWNFDVKHLPGKRNTLADFLSRNPIHPITNPIIPCICPITPADQASSSSAPPPPQPDPPDPSPVQPVFPVYDLPSEVQQMIMSRTRSPPSHCRRNWLNFLATLLANHGLCLKGLIFPVDNPFLTLFQVRNEYTFPKEALCFFWYLCEEYTIPFLFDSWTLTAYLIQSTLSTPRPNPNPKAWNLLTFLTWFHPVETWLSTLRTHFNKYVLITFKKEPVFFPPNTIFPVDPPDDPNISQSLNPTGAFYYFHNCAHIRAYYQYNIANLPVRQNRTLDWYPFLQTMIDLNHPESTPLPLDNLVENYQWKFSHPEEDRLLWTLYEHIHEKRVTFEIADFVRAMAQHRHIARIHCSESDTDAPPTFPLDQDVPSDADLEAPLSSSDSD